MHVERKKIESNSKMDNFFGSNQNGDSQIPAKESVNDIIVAKISEKTIKRMQEREREKCRFHLGQITYQLIILLITERHFICFSMNESQNVLFVHTIQSNESKFILIYKIFS